MLQAWIEVEFLDKSPSQILIDIIASKVNDNEVRIHDKAVNESHQRVRTISDDVSKAEFDQVL